MHESGKQEEKKIGEKDTSEKYLEAYPDVFADIYNTLLFKEKLIQQDLLSDGVTETIYKAEQGNYRYQNRDTMKRYDNLDMACMLLGIENQTEIDTDMPIRMMGYDYASYRRQIDEGKERHPVISIVLYFGKQRWERPLSLKDTLDLPKEIEPYVSDYRIHVFNISHLSKETRDRFTSDFKIVADFFAEKDNPEYQPSTEAITHVEAVLNLFRVFTNDDKYDKIKDEIMEKAQEGKVVTMCDFAERMWNSGEIKGKIEGKVLAYFDMGLTEEEISGKVQIPVHQVQEILHASLELA